MKMGCFKIEDSIDDNIIIGYERICIIVQNGHWENVAKNPDDPEYEGSIKYTATPKIVFTKMFIPDLLPPLLEATTLKGNRCGSR
jgi:hypothetical protein